VVAARLAHGVSSSPYQITISEFGHTATRDCGEAAEETCQNGTVARRLAPLASLTPNALRSASWVSVDSVQFLDSVHSVTACSVRHLSWRMAAPTIDLVVSN
jgi:hypothetical protein